MKNEKKGNRIVNFFKSIFRKLFLIDDSPQKIALGFGLGVFLGIFPGTGVLAAIFLSLIFRINRAASLLGSLLTNTWSSIIIFLLSIKLGAVIMRESWQDVHNSATDLFKNFSFFDLFKFSILKIILPVLIGYILIGLCLGIIAYVLALLILTKIKHEREKSRTNLSR